ncbi:two-component system, response regulator YesN [Bacillus sp. OV322]|uniref:hypothetical protein n=1 Tax=Bacillus sp. OV322 TaxID=1882764 RepID=UPI0008EFABC0|nr:hypothetical protein [Bacillus sp. OV322]SFC91888.1 two-component system, response regulator YesN [Bacillus sp. OV322]
MAEQELCRTLIVDDEILIRQGIKHYINWKQEGFIICGEAFCKSGQAEGNQ